MTKFTPEEKDRCIEVLFYLYFNNIPESKSGSTEFWTSVKTICNLYNISDLSVIKAIRILVAKENTPTEDEIYYLLNKLGISVRPLRNISGIYWQKQKELHTKQLGRTIEVHRRVTDIIAKKAMRDFILALYDIIGIFSFIDRDLLENIL